MHIVYLISNTTNNALVEINDMPLPAEEDTNELINKQNNKNIDWKTKLIYCIWVGAQVFLFSYCTASLTLVAQEGTIAAVDFAIVLLLIIGIVLSIFGTCVLVRYMSPINLGIFIGISLMLANQMFVISIMTGQDLATRDVEKKPHPQESSVAFLGAWCFISYLFVASVLWCFREHLAPNFTIVDDGEEVEEQYDSQMNI